MNNAEKSSFLIDTHCHLDICALGFDERPLTQIDLATIQTIVESSEKNNVGTILQIATTVHSSKLSLDLARHFPSIFAVIGVHPNDIQEWNEQKSHLKQLITNPAEQKIVAIGECGMDGHHKTTSFDVQKRAFCDQIELALSHDLPIVVHTRSALHETLAVLESYKKDRIRGVIHCYSEDLSFAETVISWGFKLGIGGTITYPKNELLRIVVKTVGLEHIVLETDAPFLPPQGWRGEKNSPAHILTIARFIAELLHTSFEDVATTTSDNAQALFSLPQRR